MDNQDSLRRSRALTDFPTRCNTYNWSSVCHGQDNNIGHYQPSNNLTYMTPASGQLHYSSVPSSFGGYPQTYLQTSSDLQGLVQWPGSGSTAMQYSVRPPPRSATVPSQHRVGSRGNYYVPTTQAYRSNHPHLRAPLHMDPVLMDTEDQDSINRENMRSESIEPPLEGYPKVEDFDDLMKRWVSRKGQ